MKHTGNMPQFSSAIYLDPERGIGVAVMGNRNTTYTDAIGKTIFAEMRGEPAPAIQPDLYLLTDRIATVLLVISAAGILVCFGLLASGAGSVLGGTLVPRKGVKALVCSLAAVLWIAALAWGLYVLPGMVMPGATSMFIREWFPASTLYGVLSLAVFLALASVSGAFRAWFGKPEAARPAR